MYGTECHTYSLNDGFELSLADLFDESELQRLDELIHEKIASQYNAPTDEALTEAGFFPEYIVGKSVSLHRWRTESTFTRIRCTRKALRR